MVDHPPIEVISDEMAAVLSRKSGAERLAIANRMFRAARSMLSHHLRTEHPDWSDEQIAAETARRISRGPR